MPDTQINLDRREIRAIFKRNRGAAFKLAADLKVSRTSVSMCLRGKGTSRRILDAARKRAIELARIELAAQSGNGAAA